jgi:hypothetical protein
LIGGSHRRGAGQPIRTQGASPSPPICVVGRTEEIGLNLRPGPFRSSLMVCGGAEMHPQPAVHRWSARTTVTYLRCWFAAFAILYMLPRLPLPYPGDVARIDAEPPGDLLEAKPALLAQPSDLSHVAI